MGLPKRHPAAPSPSTRALEHSLTSSSLPLNPQRLQELQLPHKHLPLGLLFLPLCLPRGSLRGSSLPSRPSSNSPSSSSSLSLSRPSNKQHLSSSRTSSLSS